MAYKLVTCPETAHLELIDYEDSPLGILIRECSRFRPSCAVGCPRTCAARLDLRERLEREHMERCLDVGDDTNLSIAVPVR